MCIRLASFTLVLAVALVAPAVAGTLYSNGPINGTINANDTCCGYVISDSFTLAASATITAFDGGFWVFTGDSPVSTSWDITTGNPSSLGGTVVSSGSGSYTNVLICADCLRYGSYYDIYRSTISGLNVSLPAGSYYWELFNGLTADRNFLYWDQNDGPSSAFGYDPPNDGFLGGTFPIPSEAFDIYGTTTPEPGTLMLLGSGVVGLAGLLHRKFNL